MDNKSKELKTIVFLTAFTFTTPTSFADTKSKDYPPKLQIKLTQIARQQVSDSLRKLMLDYNKNRGNPEDFTTVLKKSGFKDVDINQIQNDLPKTSHETSPDT